MAEALLKAWHATPIVTTVAIDAEGATVRDARSTAVSDLKSTGSRITWVQKDERLPMPINLDDAVLKLAVRSSRVMEDLDQEMLKITGLSSASYSLKINGKAIGSFTREQLASGVNLASMPTPMMTQATAVHALTLKRAAVHNTRWRNLQTPLEKEPLPRLATILDNLDALDADLAALQRSTAQPSDCFYELVAE
jgi:hypothetical protein